MLSKRSSGEKVKWYFLSSSAWAAQKLRNVSHITAAIKGPLTHLHLCGLSITVHPQLLNCHQTRYEAAYTRLCDPSFADSCNSQPDAFFVVIQPLSCRQILMPSWSPSKAKPWLNFLKRQCNLLRQPLQVVALKAKVCCLTGRGAISVRSSLVQAASFSNLLHSPLLPACCFAEKNEARQLS